MATGVIKRRKLTLLIFLVSIVVALLSPIYSCTVLRVSNVPEINPDIDFSKKYMVGYLKVLELEGSPYEIGYHHGVLLRNEIKEILDLAEEILYEEDLYQKFKAQIFARRTMKSLFEYVPEDYKLEMAGIAKGAEISLEEVFLINAFDEIYNLYGCTNAAAWGEATVDGGIIHGRNLDYRFAKNLYDKQIVYFIRPDEGIPFISVTWPGMVGALTSMNAEGLSLGSMTSKSNNNSNKGIPTGILYRMIIEKAKDLQDSEKILFENRRTIGNNLLVSSTKDKCATVFEITCDNVERIDTRNTIASTNHFEVLKEQGKEWKGIESSFWRRVRALGVMKENAPIDIYGMLKCLEDTKSQGSSGAYTAICNGSTIQSVIFLPDKLEIYIAANETLMAPKGRFWGFRIQDGSLVSFATLPVAQQYLYIRRWYATDLSYWTDDKIEDAVEAYLLENNPRYYTGSYSEYDLGVFYYDVGKPEKAIEVLEKYIDKNEFHPATKCSILAYIAMAEVESGNIEGGKKLMEDLLSRTWFPSDHQSRKMLLEYAREKFPEEYFE